MKQRLRILGCGISAPGLPDMAALARVLDGAGLDEEAKAGAGISLLSPRERRRCPESVRLSMAAAEQACTDAGIDPGELDAVFTSGMGDVAISHYMCSTLAESPDLLSPMRFHNSVHNAAAGYWSIGTGARGDITALSGATDSLVAGLIEVACRVKTHGQPVLLVVYDLNADGPIQAVWPARQPFAGALLLGPEKAGGPHLELSPVAGLEADQAPTLSPVLAERIADNPAARTLYLLVAALEKMPGPIQLAARQGPGLLIERA